MFLLTRGRQRVFGRDDDISCSPCICSRVCGMAFRVAPYAIRNQKCSLDLPYAHRKWSVGIRSIKRWMAGLLRKDEVAEVDTAGKNKRSVMGLDELENDTITMTMIDYD